jgi:phosphohistidine phosphatase
LKRLWLLRHAKAVPAEAPATDFARGLAERGERDARWVGERLKNALQQPLRIVASPAARTRRTAEIVAEVASQPSDSVIFDESLYLASAGAIAQAIMATTSDAKALVVVGHNPGLSELALELAPGLPVDDLPTSGIVGIDVVSWSELGIGRGRLRYFDFPKNDGPPVIPR